MAVDCTNLDRPRSTLQTPYRTRARGSAALVAGGKVQCKSRHILLLNIVHLVIFQVISGNFMQVANMNHQQKLRKYVVMTRKS